MRSILILCLLSIGCDKGGDSAGECETKTWYADGDGDGFGLDSDTLDACSAQPPVSRIA